METIVSETTKREWYGVVLRGVSGRDVIRFRRRCIADRVRRTVRAWIANGGWSGGQTLYDVAMAEFESGKQ